MGNFTLSSSAHTFQLYENEVRIFQRLYALEMRPVLANILICILDSLLILSPAFTYLLNNEEEIEMATT